MLGLSKLFLKSMNHLISLLFSLPRENKRLITVTVFLLWEPFCIPSYQVKWQWDAKWHNDFTLLQNSSSTVCLGSPHTPCSSSSFPLCYIFNHGFFCRRYLTWCFWSFFFFPHFLFNNVKQEFCLCPKQTELQIMCWIFPCLCHFPGIVCTCLAVVCVFLFVVCFSCFSLVCVRSLLFAGVREDACAYVEC